MPVPVARTDQREVVAQFAEQSRKFEVSAAVKRLSEIVSSLLRSNSNRFQAGARLATINGVYS